MQAMQVGDLVRAKWFGWVGIVVGRDVLADDGHQWWRVYNTSENLHKVIGEWDLVKLSCK